ncbi:AcrR family transcriptional regulator [Agromyces cerinus]|uniref:TetR/AcrR family transcriptional regulator n=1 Tax=Agromyces cerinus TaxID=33878 RepID=UPI00195EEABC|nr:TetR/AcrR family transcriptional regulator C-terminal domain-containing protein [Agromyces cerinus]MBM7832140.1 AcrR family transcriptional regulator [Agromyces cerinus]
MPRPLVDLLWRDSPSAPAGGSRGPRARYSTGDVVARAIALADEGGITAVTVRALAQSLEMTAMSVYTHVNSRDDLLVLMADHACARMTSTPFGRAAWRTRVRRVADDNLALLRAHPWLLDVDDPRTALGPGTIAKYDHELRAFDGTSIGDIQRDAALTFVLDFVRSSASRIVTRPATGEFGELWEESVASLARYVGDDFALAQRVGRAAGEAMGGPHDAERAWEYGLDRVIAGLGDAIGG